MQFHKRRTTDKKTGKLQTDVIKVEFTKSHVMTNLSWIVAKGDEHLHCEHDWRFAPGIVRQTNMTTGEVIYEAPPLEKRVTEAPPPCEPTEFEKAARASYDAQAGNTAFLESLPKGGLAFDAAKTQDTKGESKGETKGGAVKVERKE